MSSNTASGYIGYAANDFRVRAVNGHETMTLADSGEAAGPLVELAFGQISTGFCARTLSAAIARRLADSLIEAANHAEGAPA